jgi:hypothetical protein
MGLKLRNVESGVGYRMGRALRNADSGMRRQIDSEIDRVSE